MKSAVETLGPTRAKLTVEVPFEELAESLDAAYKKIAQQISVPGFRKGKVPPVVIDRQVGRGAALDEAVNDALPKLYFEAIQANDLSPLAQPEIEVTRFDDGEALEFTAEVDVRPAITLPAYEGIEASVDDLDVTDEQVEEELQSLRTRFGTLKDVDRPAADGDYVVMDLQARQDGEVVDGAEATGMSYQVGRGGMVEGLDEALVGMAAGDTRTFPTQLVGGDQLGQDVELEVAVSAVKEQELPALDDDFAQLASEFDTVDELTEDVRSRLTGSKRLEQASAARDAVLEKLLTLVEVPLPEAVVAEEIRQRRQGIVQQLAQAGVTLADYLSQQEQTEDEFEADLEKRVRDYVAAQFILDEIARVREIGVDEAELTQEMVRRAQQSGQDPNEYVRHMMEHNHIPEIVADIVRGKALAAVVESATVTDASGNVLDLGSPSTDASLADPAGEEPDEPDQDA